jgi:hypothetical protein
VELGSGGVYHKLQTPVKGKNDVLTLWEEVFAERGTIARLS